MKADLPVIAITSGEPAGIGPELCLRLVERDFPAQLVVLADRTLLAARAKAVGISGDGLKLRDWIHGQPSQKGTLDVLHQPLSVLSLPGRLDPANANYVLQL